MSVSTKNPGELKPLSHDLPEQTENTPTKPKSSSHGMRNLKSYLKLSNLKYKIY